MAYAEQNISVYGTEAQFFGTLKTFLTENTVAQFTTVSDYDATTKYYEIDPDLQLYEGQPLEILLLDDKLMYLSGTKVYLYRDITFDVFKYFWDDDDEDGSTFLKTDFRIYFDYDVVAPTPTRAFVYLSNDTNLAINGEYPGNEAGW